MSLHDPLFAEHFERLKAATLAGLTLDSLPEWIQKNTFLRGKPFSFVDHEYQLQILRDQSREKNIRKCSQVGISELAVRMALGVVNVLEGSTLIYTLPTSTFAKKFVKTRVDPVISTSPTIKRSLNITADNTELKQFNESFLYFNGTVGAAAPISVPADALTHDELDFSDPQVVSNYQSRLSHSAYKIKTKFSTPTVEGYGISEEFAHSRRFWNFVKCDHCNHQFIPDYFKHVRVPGYTGEMREIRKDNIHTIPFRGAFIECPSCGKQPSLQVQHREWVLENNTESWEAAGYQIQPFDAPNIVSCGDIILSSTTYDRYVDFINFGLGLPAEDKESTLTREELLACFVTGESPGFWTHVCGYDMGLICHIVIAGVDHRGNMMVVRTERVPLSQFERRKAELCAQYRISLGVMDSQPYADTLMREQAKDTNLYGAVYVDSKNLLPFEVKKQEEEKKEGDLEVRQVNINRNRAFDSLMTFIRRRGLLVLEDENKELFIKHCQDMKRVKDWTSDKEISFVWRKSASGDDHFHHALLYCSVAAQMRGVGSIQMTLPGLVHSFKVKS